MGYFDDLEIVQATHKIFGYHVSKPIDPPYLSLCLLRKGELIVMKDGAKRHLKAPFIFWALPGHVYQFVSVEARSRRETIWLDLGGLRARRIRPPAGWDCRFPTVWEWLCSCSGSSI